MFRQFAWMVAILIVAIGVTDCLAVDETGQSALSAARQEQIEDLRSQFQFDVVRGHFTEASKKVEGIIDLQIHEYGPEYFRVASGRQVLESLARITLLSRGEQEKARAAFMAQGRGATAFEKSDFTLAEREFQLAVELFSSILGPHDFNLLNAQGRFANVLRLTGKHDASAAVFVRVATGRLHILGKNHPLYADALGGLGLTLLEKKQYDEATQLLTAAKRSWMMNEPTSPEYVLATINLGDCYAKREMYSEAIDQFTEARQLGTAVKLPTYNPLSYNALNGLAYACVKSGRVEEAESFATEAIKAVEANWPGNCTSVATLYATYGVVLLAAGKPVEAANAEQRCRKIRSHFIGYHGAADLP